MHFQESTVVVTGGTGALGGVVAARFLALGARVAIPVRRIPEPAALPPGLSAPSDRLLLHGADITRREDVELFAAEVERRFGGIDICVHAAGGWAGGKKVEETSPEEFGGMLELNLLSAFLVCRSVLPSMRRRGRGRIVTVSAMTALRPRAGNAAYAAAKLGLIALTETIAEEVKGTGITANVLAPGTILTAANRAAMPGADTRGWVPPEEIADLVILLCSDAGAAVNGSVIRMPGGH